MFEIDESRKAMNRTDNHAATAACTPPAAALHPDDIAIDRFAAAMKAKMARSRAKGRGGWEDGEQCPAGRLQGMLIHHLAKGDPVDVGNFAMMLWNRHEPVAAPATPTFAAGKNEFERRWRAVSISVTGRADSDEAEVMRCVDKLTEYFTDGECKGEADRATGTSEAGAQCWSCKRRYTLAQRAESEGNCPHCGVEIELPAATTASAQKVLYKCPDGECGWEWEGPRQDPAPLCTHSDCARPMVEATTASASGALCENCHGTGYQIGGDGVCGGYQQCKECRSPAPSRETAPLTIGEAFAAVGGWMNGGETGYPTFGSMMALEAYTTKMIRAALAQQGAGQAAQAGAKPLAHGHRDDFYLMANGRRLAEQSMTRIRQMPNWVFASELFATGSTAAHQICRDAGVDPDGYEVERAPMSAATASQKGEQP
jgi:hypothetical protein